MELTALTGADAILRNGQKMGLNSTVGINGTSLVANEEKTDGTLFQSFLDSAVSNIETTNGLLSDYENEEIKWALGETDNPHDLTIAMGKASSALQYTVALRDKILEAYKEIMNIQI